MKVSFDPSMSETQCLGLDWIQILCDLCAHFFEYVSFQLHLSRGSRYLNGCIFMRPFIFQGLNLILHLLSANRLSTLSEHTLSGGLRCLYFPCVSNPKSLIGSVLCYVV